MQLERAKEIADSCSKQLETMKRRVKAWPNVYEIPQEKLEQLLDRCESKISQINCDLEKENVLQGNWKQLDKEIEAITGEVKMVCGVEMDNEDVGDIIENMKEKIASLESAKNQLEEKYVKVEMMKGDLPASECQIIMDKIDALEGSINSEKCRLIDLQQNAENVLMQKQESERLEEKVASIETKLKDCCKLPINERVDTANALLYEINECLEATDEILRESQTKEVNFATASEVKNKLETVKKVELDLRNDIILMKSESGRFNKAYQELIADINESEKRLLECKSRNEEMDCLKDIADCVDEERDLLFAIEDRIGELNGRLRIAGDVITKTELEDCEKRINTLKESCKREKVRLDNKAMEVKETNRFLDNFNNDLERFSEEINDVKITEKDLLETDELTQKTNEETMKTLEKIENDFNDKDAALGVHLNQIPLKDKEKIEVKRQQMERMIYDKKVVLQDNAKWLEMKQLIAKDLNETHDDIESISERLNNIYNCEKVDSVKGIFDDYETMLLTSKDRIGNVNTAFIDAKSRLSDEDQRAIEMKINDLNEKMVTVAEKAAKYKETFEGDLNKLKRIEQDGNAIQSVIVKLNKIKEVRNSDGGLKSCINEAMEIVEEAEEINDDLREDKIGNIKYASVRKEANVILKMIDENEKEREQAVETLKQKIKNMEIVENDLMKFNEELEIMDEQIAETALSAPVFEDLEGLNGHKEKCQLLLQMNEKLSKELADLISRKDNLKSKITPKDFGQIEAQLNDKKYKIDETEKKLGDEINDCKMKIDFLETIDDIKLELDDSIAFECANDMEDPETVAELSVVFDNIRSLKDTKDKLCELKNELACKDTWGKETTEKLNSEIDQMIAKINVKDAEGNKLMENISKMVKDQIDDIKRKVEMHELQNETEDANMEELQKSISGVSRLLIANGNLRKMAVMLKENGSDTGYVDDLIGCVDSLGERMNAIVENETESLEREQEMKTAMKSYEDDISNLAQQLEEMKASENEYAKKYSLHELKENNEEDEFLLSKIDEAFATILEDEEELANQLSTGKMAELLEIKSEFLEDFDYMKGKVKADRERIEKMENDFNMISDKIDDLINKTVSIKDEMAGEQFDNKDQHRSFYEEKISDLTSLENEMNAAEHEYKNAFSLLPESEGVRLHDQFNFLSIEFDEAVGMAGDELEFMEGIEMVMEELDEIETARFNRGEENIEKQVTIGDWAVERLTACDEELKKFCEKDEKKERFRHDESLAAKQLKKAMDRIESMKKSENARKKTLNALLEERKELEAVFNSKETELERVRKRLDEIKSKPNFNKKVLDDLKDLHDEVGIMEANISLSSDQFASEDVEINQRRKSLCEKIQNARNDVNVLLEKSNQCEERTELLINAAIDCCDDIKSKVDEFKGCEQDASLEKKKENIGSLRDYLNTVTKEYEKLKNDAKMLEEEFEECKNIDERLFQFEQKIIEGEEMVKAEDEKLKSLERNYNQWKEKKSTMNENLPETDVKISLFKNMEDAKLAVKNELQSLNEKESNINDLRTSLRGMISELPIAEKNEVVKDLEDFEGRIMRDKNRLNDKMETIDEITKEVKEIKKHLNVNLKWILIAKKAVMKENKAALCMEELLSERDSLVDQITSLDEDVNVIVTIGESMCEKLPNEEKDSLEKLLGEVEEEWNSVKSELSEKKERLDASIIERDAFVTSIASCLIRIEEVEDDCREVEKLDEESNREKLKNIKEQLKSLSEDNESLSHESRTILKKLVDDEKELIIDDLQNIKLRVKLLENWMKEHENKAKNRFEAIEIFKDEIQAVNAKIEEVSKIIENVEQSRDDAELIKEECLKAEKYLESASEKSAKIKHEIENKQLLSLKEEVSKTEVHLKKTGDRLADFKLKIREMMKRTHEIKENLNEYTMKTKFAERCLEFGNITDVEKNLDEIKNGLNEVGTVLDSKELFEKTSILEKLHNIEERVQFAEESLDNILQKIRIDSKSKTEDFAAIIKGFVARLQSVEDKIKEECPEKQTIDEKLKCLENSLDSLKILKQDVASELPKVLIFTNDKDENASLSLEKDCFRLQESIFEVKATLEIRIEELMEANLKIASLSNGLNGIRSEIESVKSNLKTALQKESFRQLEDKLEELGKKCCDARGACSRILSSVKSMHHKLEGNERQEVLRECNELIDEVKSVSAQIENQIESVANINKLIEMSREIGNTDDLKEDFDLFFNEMQKKSDGKQIESVMEQLQQKNDIAKQMKNELSVIEQKDVQFSDECQNKISEVIEELSLVTNEIKTEVSLLEELSLRILVGHRKDFEIIENDEKDIVYSKAEHLVAHNKEEKEKEEKKDINLVDEIGCEQVIRNDDFNAFTNEEMSDKKANERADDEELQVDKNDVECQKKSMDTNEMNKAKKELDKGSMKSDVASLSGFSASDRMSNLDGDDNDAVSDVNKSINQTTKESFGRRLENEVTSLEDETVTANDQEFGKSNGENKKNLMFVNINAKSPLTQQVKECKEVPQNDLQLDFDIVALPTKVMRGGLENSAKEELTGELVEGPLGAEAESKSSTLVEEEKMENEEEMEEDKQALENNSMADNTVADAAPLRRRSDQSVESGLASLIQTDDVIDGGNILSESLSSLETGFEDEEEIFGLMREASNELCNVDQLLASSLDHDFESIESLQKSLDTVKVCLFCNFIQIFNFKFT